MIDRVYFSFCRVIAWMLRSARYSRAQVVQSNGRNLIVRKRRSFYAPLLIWLSVPVVRALDTGVRVLARREWVERERQIYEVLRRGPVRVEPDGAVVLPYLGGETLAALLDNLRPDDVKRQRAIERAAAALADFHRLGFTHADAMAENVLVDLDAGVAHWFDFETVHETERSVTWKRADDVRALVGTCLARTVPERLHETLRLIVNAYTDKDVTRLLAGSFTSVWRRSLAFHLAQAGLSFERFHQIGRLLQEPLEVTQS
jgi:hypothetical protein